MKRIVASILAVVVVSGAVVSSTIAQSTTQSYSNDARVARIAAWRAKYPITLSETERSQLSLRCEQAQSNLQKVSSSLSIKISNYTKVYQDTIDRLNSLKLITDKKEVDGSNLDLLIVDFQRSKVEVEENAEQYAVALEDAVIIDCKAGPEDFRAALEGARESRSELVGSIRDVEDLVGSSLTTTLDSLKNKLNTDGKYGN